MQARLALGALLLVFLGLHSLYNALIPLGEGPDEPGHLAYVLFLANEGRLPVQQAVGEANELPGEGHQPPAAYALATPAVAWLRPEQRQIVLTANPHFVWAGGVEPAAFMRGSEEYWPWQALTLAWHLARGVSGLCGAVLVLFTYAAARRLRPATPALALGAAALVALNPQLLFASALVSNDMLLAALGAALLWWSLRPLSPNALPLGWALGGGVLFGLALLTKQSAVLFGPLLLWASLRASGGRLGNAATLTLVWVGAALAVAGWWYLRNWQLYGDPLGLTAFRAEFSTQPFDWRDPAAWRGALSQLFASFWARFGWLSLRPPAWAIWPYAALTMLATLGWLRGGLTQFIIYNSTSSVARQSIPIAPVSIPQKKSVKRISFSRHEPTSGGWIGPLLLVAMAGAWTLSFALVAGLVAWQGRMLFPALAAIGVLLAAGLWHGGGTKQAREGGQPLGAWLAASLALMLLALAVYFPLGVIKPAYRWQVLAPAVAQAQLGTPMYARYAQSWERGVALRGWRLDGPARIGVPLVVTLTWNSLEPIPRNWTVFVHLVDPSGEIVATSNSKPQNGALPFVQWTPGDWVADQHRLALPAALPTGDYLLRVGLYRPEKNDQRQGVWAANGDLLGDYAELGAVRVER